MSYYNYAPAYTLVLFNTKTCYVATRWYSTSFISTYVVCAKHLKIKWKTKTQLYRITYSLWYLNTFRCYKGVYAPSITTIYPSAWADQRSRQSGCGM